MTREELHDLKLGFQLSETTLKIADALEQAWAERDDAIKARDFLTGQNSELIEDLEALKVEHDNWKEIAGNRYAYDTLLVERNALKLECDAFKTELQVWRSDGLTEEILRNGDGYIKVGQGCLIISEHYLEELNAEIAALKAEVEELSAVRVGSTLCPIEDLEAFRLMRKGEKMAKQKATDADVEAFLTAVYGEYTHLAMSCFDEKHTLKTATALILELRQEIESLKAKVENSIKCQCGQCRAARVVLWKGVHDATG